MASVHVKASRETVARDACIRVREVDKIPHSTVWIASLLGRKRSSGVRSNKRPSVSVSFIKMIAIIYCMSSAAAQSHDQREFITDDGSISSKQELGACSDARLSQLRRDIEHGEFEDNAHALEAEATQCSGKAQYHVLVSLAFKKKGDLAKAAKELDTAIRLDPHNPDYFFQLTQILFENGDLGGARLLLERANRDFPNEVWTYLFLASIYRQLDSVNEAEQVLAKAESRWPLKPEVHILLGNMISATGQHSRALAEYEWALRIDSKLPQAYLFYGIELDKLNRTEDALNALNKCIQLAPLMPNSHYYLGTLLLKKREPTEAVRQLETAIKIDPRYALAYFQLGKAYRQLGDLARGQEYMEKYGMLSEEQKSEDAQRSKRFRDSLTNH
jgi:tetratricopeptide (TPR) repeat protein